MTALPSDFRRPRQRVWGRTGFTEEDALIELAEVITQLRTELDRARAAAAGEDLQFELGPVELEVAIAVEAVGGAEAKVRFWVVEIGGNAQATSASTQRIKLTLHPAVTAGAGPEGGRKVSAFISGGEVPGER